MLREGLIGEMASALNTGRLFGRILFVIPILTRASTNLY